MALFNGLLLLLVILALSGVWLKSGSRTRSAFWQTGLRWGSVICLVGGGLLVTAGLYKLAAVAMAVGVATFFGWVILLPATPLAERVLWLWIAPPFWLYVFFVNRPGKHHYLFLSAILLLLGLTVTRLWHWAQQRRSGQHKAPVRWAVGVVAGLLFLIFAGHTALILLRSDLEYVLTYPEHRSTFYPTDGGYPYRTRIGFGYPFRLGWQTIGALRRTGQLEGSWAANDAGREARYSAPSPRGSGRALLMHRALSLGVGRRSGVRAWDVGSGSPGGSDRRHRRSSSRPETLAGCGATGASQS